VLGLLEILKFTKPLKEFPSLWIPAVYHCAHNSPTMDPNVSQLNPVHTFSPYSTQLLTALTMSRILNFADFFIRKILQISITGFTEDDAGDTQYIRSTLSFFSITLLSCLHQQEL
jgi:hypothetical protein